MIRFQDVPESVENLVNEVKNRYFRELVNAKIKVLFDLKKRTSSGKLIMGRMQKTNSLLRHLTAEEARNEEGYDYIMYLDKMVFEHIERIDQERIIRHELQHTDVDTDVTRGTPYKLRDHELSDFYEEIERNQDDPRWAEKCATIGMSLYEQE
jgi:hypothetical protein